MKPGSGCPGPCRPSKHQRRWSDQQRNKRIGNRVRSPGTGMVRLYTILCALGKWVIYYACFRPKAIGNGDLSLVLFNLPIRPRLSLGTFVGNVITDFVVRAIGLAGGRCRRQDGRIVVTEVPISWVGARVLASYDALFNEPDASPSGTPTSSILDEDHPLAQAAIRWVRGSRYDPRDDHRLVVRVLDTIDGPDLVASYIVTLRAGDNTEMERLMAVRVRPDGTVDSNDSADQIPGQGVADLPGLRVHEIFGTWWESANRVADEEVKRRAENWMNEIRTQRLAEHSGLRDRFKIWADATRKAILGEYDDPTTFLPGIERELPPTVKRRLREHRKEVDEHESFLNRRVRFEPAAVESLGVLLRAPAKESKP